MFAPKVAKPQEKASANSTSSLSHQSSAPVAYRPGYSTVEQAFMLPTLRLLAQQSSNLAGPRGHNEQETGPVSSAAREAKPGVSLVFCKIPTVPDQPSSQAHSPLLSPGIVQPKLAIGAVNDPLEREADAVAEQVMRAPASALSISPALALLSRKCDACEEEDEKDVQRKPAPGTGTPSPVAQDGIGRATHQLGQPLDPALRAYFEPRFGYDFRDVRIHTGTGASASASAVGALAYTVGQDIVFASGRFAPHTESGRRLLAHELVHTVQQRGGLKLVQRKCEPAECPEAAIYLPAQYPLWLWAEQCIQGEYARTHPESRRYISLSFNADWRNLVGGTPNEQQALSCLQNPITGGQTPHFTARSGTHGGEPDIWDFRNKTIYEITTSYGENERIARVEFEVDLANDICGSMDCGGLHFDAGNWQPPEKCYKLYGPLRLEVFRNNAGVIVYAIAVSLRRLAELVSVLGAAWIIRYVPSIARGLGLAATGELAAVRVGANLAARGTLASSSAGAGAEGSALASAGAGTEGGTLATAGAATEAGVATEATGGVLVGGGAVTTVAAVALPLISMAAVFVALGSGYAAAREEVRNESTASGFSQGFVMGILGWDWHQAVERFGRFGVIQTPEDEAIGVIKVNAHNRGLKAGFQAGANLSDADKKAYLSAIRRYARTRVPGTWSRLDQIDYVIKLAAAARVHFLRPE